VFGGDSPVQLKYSEDIRDNLIKYILNLHLALGCRDLMDFKCQDKQIGYLDQCQINIHKRSRGLQAI
jgi:hypothetical protein